MVRVYRIPPERVQREKRRMATAIITLFVALPVSIGLVALYFRLDLRSLTLRDFASTILMLGIPCAALWLHTLTLPSLKIEFEDDRITKTQVRPFGTAPLKLSFDREEINHIREVRRSGLMVRGRGSRGRYIDLHIPRSVENYDDLKSRLTAWYPVQESWM
jgi:hypothetical protein